jgi:ADP-ribose pyrophosphatase YjhB (NUDIX family)
MTNGAGEPGTVPLDPGGLPDPGRPRFCARCGGIMAEVAQRLDRPRPRCTACGWTYYARNSLGAAILVEREGKVLLVQRGHPPYLGDWMLPAGFVEYGEHASETAVREAEEECGVRVTVMGSPGVHFGTDDPRNPGYLLVYRATLVDVDAAPVAGDDAAACEWFGHDDLPANIAFMAHRAAITAWRDHGLPTGNA